VSAFAAMAVCFALWWWYFDVADAAGEQLVRNSHDAVRFHLWTYAHLPLYLGVVVLGVGMQRVVTAASRYAVPLPERAMLGVAGVTVICAMAVITAMTDRKAHQVGRDHIRLTA
jgi:low temperature requirement protein LtrA